VEAGVDRVVILGGKTYLNATIKTLAGKGPLPKVAWGKVSGPGSVAFEKADSPTTTATFSEVGDYILKLTAGKGSLSASSTLNVKVDLPPPANHLDMMDTKRYTIDRLWASGRHDCHPTSTHQFCEC
ncbi:hypothetical protein ACFL5Z_12165, partial [Planctomycetota bacterium]